MSIKWFDGQPQINVETPKELHEALDVLHTQVMDNLPEDEQNPFLRILEEAMDAIEREGVEV